MIFHVTFKTPDALEYATENMTDEEKETAENLANKFIRFDEYVTIEFDTEKNTATVNRA